MGSVINFSLPGFTQIHHDFLFNSISISDHFKKGKIFYKIQ